MQVAEMYDLRCQATQHTLNSAKQMRMTRCQAHAHLLGAVQCALGPSTANDLQLQQQQQTRSLWLAAHAMKPSLTCGMVILGVPPLGLAIVTVAGAGVEQGRPPVQHGSSGWGLCCWLYRSAES